MHLSHFIFRVFFAALVLCIEPLGAWNIAERQTEASYRQNDFAPPLEGECDDYEESGILSLVKGVWRYGTCILSSVPKINGDILDLLLRVQDEVKRQDLEKASEAQLASLDEIGHIMLDNVRIHEDMVHDYADKHLLFGRNSPVLESHEPAKELILRQIDLISKHAGNLAKQKLNAGSEQIKPSTGKYFKRMLEMHLTLWKGSPKYRDMIGKINEKGEKVSLLDKEEALSKYREKGDAASIKALGDFKFRAQWAKGLKAVIFLDPSAAKDSDLGSTIAFEMTNAFQDDRFTQVQALATSGAFDNLSIRDERHRIEEGAHRYTHAMEQIENEGRTIHDQILEEALKTGTIDESWLWSPGQKRSEMERLHTDLLGTEYGQKHMSYYRDYYEQQIAPHLKQQREQNAAARMALLREKQRPK